MVPNFVTCVEPSGGRVSASSGNRRTLNVFNERNPIGTWCIDDEWLET